MAMGIRAGTRVPTASPVRRSEAGAVTAEAAVVIPLLVAVALALAWLLSVVASQIRVVDAAREAARVAAPGAGTDAAEAAGARVAPTGTRFRVTTGGGQVEVAARVDVHGPGGLFGFIP